MIIGCRQLSLAAPEETEGEPRAHAGFTHIGAAPAGRNTGALARFARQLSGVNMISIGWLGPLGGKARAQS